MLITYRPTPRARAMVGPASSTTWTPARKNFQILERVRLQLRFDVFNALNHLRFAAPDTNPSDSTFGRVTPSQQNQARSVELGARMTF